MESTSTKCAAARPDHVMVKFSGTLAPSSENTLYNSDAKEDLFTITTGAAGTVSDAGASGAPGSGSEGRYWGAEHVW